MLRIEVQPDDMTCGPTCLHAVYRHYGDDVPLAALTEEVEYIPTGGTLAVLLGCHALERGYTATIYSYNLQVFDPTWFALDRPELERRLRARAAAKRDRPKLGIEIDAYLRFLELGGEVGHEELTPGFLARLLEQGPLLTGLSATYLYNCRRELDGRYDDIAGEPTGHFVVLHHYDDATGSVEVADPLVGNPTFPESHYVVPAQRLIASILLGIVTYDANLMLIEPARDPPR